MTHPGCFVALESLDGVGKTTLVHSLAKALHAVAMATPGPLLRPFMDSLLELVGDNQTARAALYASTVLREGSVARAQAAQGRWVVMDRYWLSTLAYARARGLTDDLSRLEASVCPPDVTLVLTLEENERVRRLRERSTFTSADAETLDPRFRDMVMQEMLDPRRAERFGVITLDVTGLDPAQVTAAAVQLLFEWRQLKSAA
jgi:dTMP kinase